MSDLPSNFMKLIRTAYPKRSGGQGWAKAEELIRRTVAGGEPFEDILAGTERYAHWARATGKERTELVKMAQTFYGPGRWWQEDYDLPAGTSNVADLASWAEAKR